MTTVKRISERGNTMEWNALSMKEYSRLRARKIVKKNRPEMTRCDFFSAQGEISLILHIIPRRFTPPFFEKSFPSFQSLLIQS